MKIRVTIVIICMFAVGFAAVVYVRYRRDIQVARIHSSSGSKTVSSPCGVIEYADAGTGPVIFAIHALVALSTIAWTWRAISSELDSEW